MISYFLFECNSLTVLIDADELIPADGKDETYDEVITEIHDLEKSLDADLLKFEKNLGCVSTDAWMMYCF